MSNLDYNFSFQINNILYTHKIPRADSVRMYEWLIEPSQFISRQETNGKKEVQILALYPYFSHNSLPSCMHTFKLFWSLSMRRIGEVYGVEIISNSIIEWFSEWWFLGQYWVFKYYLYEWVISFITKKHSKVRLNLIRTDAYEGHLVCRKIGPIRLHFVMLQIRLCCIMVILFVVITLWYIQTQLFLRFKKSYFWDNNVYEN